ncbi:MAG TPA: pyridoxamine 5'-phosphate oxidase family protein [Bryobacteraceae bacterium]|nr:pyridoxamine 5'-phosphate oxidase family protein [Bryobacteraceae bacterium]
MSLTREDIYSFIRQRKLGVLSTISGSLTPQSALIGVAVTSNLEIIFDTTKSTRKYLNLITRPQCSLVIGWEAEQTLQYEGRAEEIRTPDLARYQEIYFRAWAEGLQD